MQEILTKSYQGADLSGMTSGVIYLPISYDSTILAIKVKTDVNVVGDAEFVLTNLDHTPIAGTSLTIESGTKKAVLTGLEIVRLEDADVLLKLVSGAVSSPITLVLVVSDDTYSDTTAALSDLLDVVIDDPQTGDALVFNGTDWVNQPAGTGGGSADLSSIPAVATGDFDWTLVQNTNGNYINAAGYKLVFNNNYWYSCQAYAAIFEPGYAAMTIQNYGSSSYFWGFSSTIAGSAFSSNADSFEFCMHVRYQDNLWSVYESGVLKHASGLSGVAMIERLPDGTINYYVGGTLVYTSLVPKADVLALALYPKIEGGYYNSHAAADAPDTGGGAAILTQSIVRELSTPNDGTSIKWSSSRNRFEVR